MAAVPQNTASPVRPGPGPTAPAALPRDEACAAEVLEVMPVVMDAMRSAMRQQVGEALSVPQFRALNFISRRPGSSISAVAALLGVTMPTASAMVDRLVRAGAVALHIAEDDRRRSELHVTPEGDAQMQQIRRGAHGEFARALAGCSDDELRSVQAGLAVLRRSFAAA